MYLGIDLGTSHIKAIVVDQTGQVVNAALTNVDCHHTPNNIHGIEQDIEQIWAATLTAIQQAVDSKTGPAIRAIGISSQGGAIQILDQNNQPHGPVISWMDSRGKPYDQQFNQTQSRDWFATHTGHGASGMTIGQYLRLVANKSLPKNFRIGYVGDVIVDRLCGRGAHDATSLSIAMLLNPTQAQADPSLLAQLQLTQNQLPDLLNARTPAGGLQPQVAKQTLLSPGIPVSPAMHDQYAAALGCGAVHRGDVMFGAGTAWVLLAMTDQCVGPVIDEAFVCPHPIEGLYGQLLSMVNGGSALSWISDLLDGPTAPTESLDCCLQKAAPGCEGLLFHPCLVGNNEGGGSIHGLKLSHGREHFLRATIEGLACELAKHLLMLTDAGLELKQLIMTGQAAKSHVTPQIIASVTGLDVVCVQEPAGSALGAAVLARALTEPQHLLADLARDFLPDCSTVKPDFSTDVYPKLLQRYLSMELN